MAARSEMCIIKKVVKLPADLICTVNIVHIMFCRYQVFPTPVPNFSSSYSYANSRIIKDPRVGQVGYLDISYINPILPSFNPAIPVFNL